MAFTNTNENGLESLIVKWLIEHNTYEQGTNADYNRDYAIDETRLFRFLQDTQPDALEKLGVFKTDIKKKQFLNRLQGEIAKRGVIDVLRNGVKVYPANLIMFYLTPTENNAKAKEMYEKNIFSVTRQLMYSNDSTRLALDMCIFINGLPVITFELKNQLTKQNVDDAVQQYKDDRDPRELLFQFKRCMVHFAVDDARVKFCTKLDGKKSWFLPFDKGYNDGAGNPPNPDGLMTDYLWKKILTKDKLSRIIENYAQVVIEEDPETKKKSVKQIFPRYHQLDCVEKLLADVKTNGVGKRYLIQHSAGSGKSNSIAWLAHQLIGLEKDGHPMIDSVLVVTDRRILDKQIRDNIKQFMQVANTVAWAEHSGDLRKAIQDGKRIIITTVEKFPYVVPDIGATHKTNHFAVIIDEAHSGFYMHGVVLCRIWKLHVLLYAHYVTPAILVFLSNAVLFEIGKALAGSRGFNYALGFVLLAGILQFSFVSSYSTSEFLLTRGAEAKGYCANVIIPTVFLIALHFRKVWNSRKYWVLLFLLCAGCDAVSFSSVLLVPTLITVICSAVFAVKRERGIWWRYAVTMVIPAIYAGVYFAFSINLLTIRVR